jgi:molecular chaperone GrpE
MAKENAEEKMEDIQPDDEASANGDSATSENGAAEGQDGEVLVSVTYEEYDQMQADLEGAQARASENLDRYQRALADYSNLKRRVEKERAEMHHNATGNVIKPFLEVLDDVEIALSNRPDQGSGKAWADGIEHVHRKLLSKLDAQGVELINTPGDEFDPFYHEAIGQDESGEFESGTVAHILKPGYRIGERVLRPALVRVAA